LIDKLINQVLIIDDENKVEESMFFFDNEFIKERLGFFVSR
jgi:hypothetical protein